MPLETSNNTKNMKPVLTKKKKKTPNSPRGGENLPAATLAALSPSKSTCYYINKNKNLLLLLFVCVLPICGALTKPAPKRDSPVRFEEKGFAATFIHESRLAVISRWDPLPKLVAFTTSAGILTLSVERGYFPGGCRDNFVIIWRLIWGCSSCVSLLSF